MIFTEYIPRFFPLRLNGPEVAPSRYHYFAAPSLNFPSP